MASQWHAHNPYAGKGVARGSDVNVRLYDAQGNALDIIEATEIDQQPMLKDIPVEALAESTTQHNVHSDKIAVTIKGVTKGHSLKDEVLRQVKRNQTDGKAFEKYSANIKYRDANTGIIKTLALVDCDMIELDAFASGGLFAAGTEGFQLVGNLDSWA